MTGVFKDFRNKFKAFFTTKFNVSILRLVIILSIVSLTLNELYTQSLLKRSVDAGELPGYINDVVFTSVSAVEGILIPILMWVGYKKRFRFSALWTLLAALMPLPLFFLPMTSINRENGDLCNLNQPRLTTAASGKLIGRTVVAIFVALVCALTRSVVWIQALDELNKRNPKEIALNFALLLSARIKFLIMGKFAIQQPLNDRWMSLFFLSVPPAITTALLLWHSKFDEDQLDSADDRKGFFRSIWRTLSNKTVMLHTAALSFLVAGVWGFSFLNTDVLKTKYLMTLPENFFEQLVIGLPLLLLFYVVASTSATFSEPNMMKFDSKLTIKYGTIRTVFIAVVVLVLTLVTCTGGAMVGLSSDKYTQPSCSSSCRCAPTWNEFSPVCSVTGMNTFYSPCHAGCTSRDTYNDTTFFSKCGCSESVSEVMTVGPCNGRECFPAYAAHLFLMAVVYGFTVSAAVAHFLVIYKSVEVRDRTMAVSILFSSTTLIAFVGGHWIATTVSNMTCAFTQNGRCDFHNSQFPTTLGISSLTLITISFIISLTSCISHRKMNNSGREESMRSLDKITSQ